MLRAAAALTVIIAMLALILRFFWKVDAHSVEKKGNTAATTLPAPSATASDASPTRRAVVLPDASATPSPPPGVNGADLYKRAFELFSALTQEEKNMLAHPRDEVDAEKADALFEKIQPIMELLRQAKGATYVDWGLGKMRFDKPMPQLKLVTDLGRLALWDAAYLFPTDSESAVLDLSARVQLGRSIGGDGLIGFLVESSLTTTGIDLIRNNAASLTPPAFSDVMQMVDPSSSTEHFATAMNFEAENFAQALAEMLNDPHTRQKVLDDIGGVLPPGSNVPDIQSLTAQMKWLAQTEKTFAQKATLPDAQFDAWWSQITEEASSQPVAAAAVPNLKQLRTRYQFDALNRSMLATGLAVMQGGPEQIGLHLDPTTGKSFTYVQTATGFELRSTFANQKMPVTMTFPSNTTAQ